MCVFNLDNLAPVDQNIVHVLLSNTQESNEIFVSFHHTSVALK